jgi:hypothetical protein
MCIYEASKESTRRKEFAKPQCGINPACIFILIWKSAARSWFITVCHWRHETVNTQQENEYGYSSGARPGDAAIDLFVYCVCNGSEKCKTRPLSWSLCVRDGMLYTDALIEKMCVYCRKSKELLQRMSLAFEKHLSAIVRMFSVAICTIALNSSSCHTQAAGELFKMNHSAYLLCEIFWWVCD